MATSTEPETARDSDTPRKEISLGLRAAIVAWKSPFGGKSTNEIVEKTGLQKRSIDRIYARAIERGFEPNAAVFELKDEHIADAARTGRSRKDRSPVRVQIQSLVKRDRYGRENPVRRLLAS